MTWPAEPVVAKAYVDQLERSGKLSASTIADMRKVLDAADNKLSQNTKDRKVAKHLKAMAKKTDHTALNQLLKDIAQRL